MKNDEEENNCCVWPFIASCYITSKINWSQLKWNKKTNLINNGVYGQCWMALHGQKTVWSLSHVCSSPPRSSFPLAVKPVAMLTHSHTHIHTHTHLSKSCQNFKQCVCQIWGHAVILIWDAFLKTILCLLFLGGTPNDEGCTKDTGLQWELQEPLNLGVLSHPVTNPSVATFCRLVE